MQDVRTALRALLTRPAFTLMAVTTLALGIGANTAVYTVVHGILLQPLPYKDHSQVVVLNEVSPQYPNPLSVSWQNYVDWRDRSTTFETVAAFRSLQVTLTGVGEAERVPARMVTSTLLPMLGVDLPLGRQFTTTDDAPGAAGVVVISDSLWRRKLGAQQDVLGRTIQLDKQPSVIVGGLACTIRAVPARRSVRSDRSVGRHVTRRPRMAPWDLAGGAARRGSHARAGAGRDGNDQPTAGGRRSAVQPRRSSPRAADP